MKRNWGMPVSGKCEICGRTDNICMDTWFCYETCETHQNVPPAFSDKAKKQYERTGVTDWDFVTNGD